MNISKQLAAWGTGLRHKFRHDIFFSTRVKIIACLSLFVASIAASFIILIEYVKNIMMIGIVESLILAVSNKAADPAILAASSRATENATYGTILIVVFFALLSAIAVSRLALAPIKQAFHIQKRFISGIAHELRTPLSIIRINNEIARFDLDSSSPIAKIIDETISDIDRISEMLSNLLLFDRMASIESLRFGEVSLTSVLDGVTARLSKLASQKGIVVSIVGSPFPSVRGNETALEQVFFNILKNALSYSQEGREVQITCAGITDTSILIKVSDTGVGIPQKDLPHIFEPFYRAEKTGKLSGTGIGLAIVFEIMKLHKGTIEVESSEGNGTSFLLSLPLFTPTKASENANAPSKISFNFLNGK